MRFLSQGYAAESVISRGADVLHRAANRVSPTYVLQVLGLTVPVMPGAAPRYQYVVLDEPALLRFAEDPAADLTKAFVRDACRRGDRCYAALDGDVLASYQWCSSKSTRVNDGLMVTVPPGWTYKYKALTMRAYRGQRLHANLTHLVQRDAAISGAGGVFACVEINNTPSLHSFARMRATRLGTVGAIQLLGRYRTVSTPECRRIGVGLIAIKADGGDRPSPTP